VNSQSVDIQTYIYSGVVESFCLGTLSGLELDQFIYLLAEYPKLQDEVERVQATLGNSGEVNNRVFSRDLKKKILDSIKDLETSSIERQSVLDLIHPNSGLQFWEDKIKAIEPPAQIDGVFLSPLRQTDKIFQFAAWVEKFVDPEIHEDMIESFFILEGTCTCTVGDNTIDLVRGNFLEIPLHTSHSIQVTSPGGVKAILQRIYL